MEPDFGDMPEKLREEYLDIYYGIQSKILSTTRFDENSDFSTTYLGKVDITRASKIKVEEHPHYQNTGILLESYWMDHNVRYYWIQELANNLCLNHTIFIVNYFSCYLSLHLKLREFK